MLKCDEKSVSSNSPVFQHVDAPEGIGRCPLSLKPPSFAVVRTAAVCFLLLLLLLRLEPAETRTGSALLSNSQSKVLTFVVWLGYNRGGAGRQAEGLLFNPALNATRTTSRRQKTEARQLAQQINSKAGILRSARFIYVLCRIMPTPLRFVMTTACTMHTHTAMLPRGGANMCDVVLIISYTSRFLLWTE